jgi:hypothetical protein
VATLDNRQGAGRVGAQRDSQFETVLHADSVLPYKGDALAVDTIGRNVKSLRHIGKAPTPARSQPVSGLAVDVMMLGMTAVTVIGDK